MTINIWVAVGIMLLAGFIVRRLLGIKRGRWITTGAAVLVGEAATIWILQTVTGDVLNLGWIWLPLGCMLVAALSMVAFVLFELMAPPRRRRGLRLPRPVAALRRSARYGHVLRIAVRQGLLRGGDSEVSGSWLGRALAGTFDEAGGLFVKLGQAMAAQPQLVTPAVAAELAKLQSQAAPADPAAALAVLREEIGSPDEVFAEFAPEPVAAASIGQTYFAVLIDGRDVVVKVQRPGILESVERDLDILLRLVKRLEDRTAWAKSLGLEELTAGFAESTREELDFRIEALNSTTARAALDPLDLITAPDIIDSFTSRRVLVQERVEGQSVGAAGVFNAVDAERRRTLADALLSLLVRQMIRGERFHADPHPGNVFLRTDGRLALIDFGSVGRLNRFERAGLIDILRGLQTEDPSLLRQAALRIGTPGARIDIEALDRELARLLARNVEFGVGVNPNIFGDIVSIFRDFGIFLPTSTVTLFRTILTLLGTLDVISPGYDVTGAMQRLGGEFTAAVREMTSVKDLLLTTAPILARLPQDIDDVARSLLRGELRARVSLLSEPEDVEIARSMLNRFVMGMIGSALAVASAIMLTVQTEPGHVALLSVVGGTGLAIAFLLLLRMIVQILREQRLNS